MQEELLRQKTDSEATIPARHRKLHMKWQMQLLSQTIPQHVTVDLLVQYVYAV